MSLDRDVPMSRTQVRAMVVGLVVLGVLGFALFGGLIPGLQPNYTAPATVPFEGGQYYETTVTLPMPAPFNNSTIPQPYPFHSVTFWLWITQWGAITGALVNGNGTEANGTVFSFVLGEPNVTHGNAPLYVSPDREFAVRWGGGILGGPWVLLLVRV